MAESLTEALARSSGRPAQWSAVADGWARRREYVWQVSRPVAERLVDALAPQPGETVLELAAGPGDTGFLAAPRLEPGGRLVSTDVAPEMVEAARARAAELGLRNVEHRVADAQELPFPDASVDAVLCRWGYMLVPDPARALAETRRVLRPGGRAAFAVWAEAGANPWGTAVGTALLERGHVERPDPDAPGPFRLGDPERVRRLVLAAGFAEPVLEEVPVTWRYASFDEYWDVTADLSFLLRTALSLLGAAELEQVRRRAAEILAAYADAEGRLEVPGLCRNVLARRP